MLQILTNFEPPDLRVWGTECFKVSIIVLVLFEIFNIDFNLKVWRIIVKFSKHVRFPQIHTLLLSYFKYMNKNFNIMGQTECMPAIHLTKFGIYMKLQNCNSTVNSGWRIYTSVNPNLPFVNPNYRLSTRIYRWATVLQLCIWALHLTYAIYSSGYSSYKIYILYKYWVGLKATLIIFAPKGRKFVLREALCNA